MHKVNIKPLSVNEAYTGRRFSTPSHTTFKKRIAYSLPKKVKVPDGAFFVYYIFGLSSSLSDWDNCIKTTQDCLQKKYKFNDMVIKAGVVKVEMVPVGQEFVQFKFMELSAFAKIEEILLAL